MGFDLPNKLADLKLFFTLNLNQRKHITYPSPNPTLNPTCYQLIIFSWVRGGVGVQLLRCLHSPPAERFGTLREGVCRGLGTNHEVISPRPLAELSPACVAQGLILSCGVCWPSARRLPTLSCRFRSNLKLR